MNTTSAIVFAILTIAVLAMVAWFVTQQQKAARPTSSQLIGGGAGNLITGILQAAGVQ